MLSSNFIENLGGGVQLEMIAIPGGSFQMGDNEFTHSIPVSTVTVPPFYLGRYSVTQEQHQAIVNPSKIFQNFSYYQAGLYPQKGWGNPSYFQKGWENPSYFQKGGKYPVENLSWNDSIEFCKRLSQKTGKNYRLPTEAEWEYACRAGTQTKYHFGDDENQLGNYAWYGRNSNGETHPVGQKQSNQFGLYDMHGNVWEWLADRWHKNYKGAPTDGSSWETGTVDNYRVLRGGSWNDLARNCRPGVRSRLNADPYNYSFGFRVACSSFLPRTP